MVQHLPAYPGHMGMGIVVQHNDTPHENARTLSLDGSTKVSKSYTVPLSTDGDVRVLEANAKG
jgi:hypothetical protein